MSTNIAEASITIPDVIHVIDSGRVKEMRLDNDRNMSCLMVFHSVVYVIWIDIVPQELHISQASARQRKGRAGRVSDGILYRMYSEATHNEVFAPFTKPEMQCAPLQELILQVKLLDLGSPAHFLSKCMSPPPIASIENAVHTLVTIGALLGPPPQQSRAVRGVKPGQRMPPAIAVHDGQLTPLGYHIASFSCDARVGKMLLLGALFGVSEQVLTMAAALSCKSPFLTPFGKQAEADKAKRKFDSSGSDHIAVLRAYEEFKELDKLGVQRSWCSDNFLSLDTLQTMGSVRQQLKSQLQECGFLSAEDEIGAQGESTSPMSSAGNELLLPGILCAAMFPNLCTVRNNSGKPCSVHSRDEEVFFHPCSVHFKRSDLAGGQWYAYLEKVATSKVYIRDATRVTPLAILLFGGKVDDTRRKGVVTLDGWVQFTCRPNVRSLVEALRSEVEQILLHKAQDPHSDVARRTSLLQETIIQLISEEMRTSR